MIWSGLDATLPGGQGHTKSIVGISLACDHSRLYSLGGEELRVLSVPDRAFTASTECKGQTIAVAASRTHPGTAFVLHENGLLQRYTDCTLAAEYKLGYECSALAAAP